MSFASSWSSDGVQETVPEDLEQNLYRETD